MNSVHPCPVQAGDCLKAVWNPESRDSIITNMKVKSGNDEWIVQSISSIPRIQSISLCSFNEYFFSFVLCMYTVLRFIFNSTNSNQDQIHKPYDSTSDARGPSRLFISRCLCCYTQVEGSVVISIHMCYFARQCRILMYVHYNYF